MYNCFKMVRILWNLALVVILKHKPRTVSSPELLIIFGALTLDVSKLRKVVIVTLDEPCESHC